MLAGLFFKRVFMMVVGECRRRQGILLLEAAHFGHCDGEESGSRGSGCLFDGLALLRQLSPFYTAVQRK